MNSISEDISTLTTIPKYAIDKLVMLTRYCICHYVEETKLNKDEFTSIDIGIGDLLVKETDEGVKYKFIPSKALEKAIFETIRTGNSPLINEAENIFIDRIINTYKDLL